MALWHSSRRTSLLARSVAARPCQLLAQPPRATLGATQPPRTVPNPQTHYVHTLRQAAVARLPCRPTRASTGMPCQPPCTTHGLHAPAAGAACKSGPGTPDPASRPLYLLPLSCRVMSQLATDTGLARRSSSPQSSRPRLAAASAPPHVPTAAASRGFFIPARGRRTVSAEPQAHLRARWAVSEAARLHLRPLSAVVCVAGIRCHRRNRASSRTVTSQICAGRVKTR